MHRLVGLVCTSNSYIIVGCNIVLTTFEHARSLLLPDIGIRASVR